MNIRTVIAGHARLFIALAIGIAGFVALPQGWAGRGRFILCWDIGAATYLVLIFWLFATTPVAGMQANAQAQEDGEWTLFWLVLAGVVASFAAIIGEFSSMKAAASAARDLKVALVAGTLLLSWLLSQVVFGLRYAHEFYSRSGEAEIDGGLEFPGETRPDYFDFVYFAVVLGMTFQVSDVQITSRKLRRLALVHGLLGFMFNTVIIALTVNLASGLLS